MRPGNGKSRATARILPALAVALTGLALIPAGARAQAGAQETAFRHADHELVDCLVCHESGTPTMRTDRAWCSDCHHSRRTSASCATCHPAEELRGSTYRVPRTMEFSVGTAAERELPFRHEVHESLSCGQCHQRGPDPGASGLDCTECHEEHHSLESRCAACHREAPEEAHPTEAHLTCQGSGCHSPAPVAEPPPRERGICLACHQELSDHRPDGRCADCHVLPPPNPVTAGPSGGGDR